MSEKNTQFSGSIPKQYDKYLGPLLFEFSAKDLAKRVSQKIPADSKVLEIACGTGISTEYLRESLPESTSIMATDLNEAMLDFAKQKHGKLKNVEYKIADALNLPFEDESFDAVICQFGIMFFPDKQKGLSEMIRVLKPNGIIAFNVWDSLDKNKVVKISKDIIETFFDSDPPKFLEMPFSYNNIEEITNLMKTAGLKNIAYEYVAESFENYSADHIARGFVTGNPTINEINQRGNSDVEEIIKNVAAEIKKVFGKDNPKVSFQEIVFLGTKS